MCQMRVVVNRIMLGTRELGWELWSGKDVMEMTSNQIKNLVKAGTKVCGLTIGKSGELELDKEGFYTTNMTVHSHIGSWVPMNDGGVANLLYVCIGKHEENGKTVYDCISSRFEQAKITEADMRAYLKIGIVSGGAKLDGDNIILAELEFPKAEKQETVEPVKTVETVKAVEPASEEKKEAEAAKASIAKQK